MTQFKDQLNRTISLERTPRRIISLVPSQTELLCDLGLEEVIVGVTKFCVHPLHIKSKATIVGGTKQIHTDKVKALRPDIILCNKEENTKDIVEACESICPVHVSDIFTLNDSLELIKQYGNLFNVNKKAVYIINTIKRESQDFAEFISNKPKINAVYFIWRNPWMVAANNTFINYMLQINNFNNCFGEEDRYPEIQLSVNEKVQIVLLSSEPYPFKEVHKNELKKVYPNAKLVLVDGEMFSWYGSRLTKAFKYFKQLYLNLC
ncbi:ABC transporter substrate-binding protein [Seonamhaeicola marinus]|uniref:ABC transporter substrate-binding protein n=1 Tax=Seonamhaeicola marinus TaxID=1912246 RepID=A0A5D0JDY5_9FLAO|nr:helical backbone metal receptor [Seonamhaeicola marinus]TYA92092.1 ABC transporter substrate-binding protein [Seonamhaeicola marinus]